MGKEGLSPMTTQTTAVQVDYLGERYQVSRGRGTEGSELFRVSGPRGRYLLAARTLACQCPGWAARGRCRHGEIVAMAKAQVADARAAAQATTPATPVPVVEGTPEWDALMADLGFGQPTRLGQLLAGRAVRS